MENNTATSQPGCSLPDSISTAPLIRLSQPVRGLNGVSLLGKAEWASPCGSIKHRAAAAMLRDARDRGALTHGKTILDASSGNTGIALAMFGAALGLQVHLAMPASVTAEHKSILRACGATVDWTDAGNGIDGAILRARELDGNHPGRFCYLDQFSNDANWLAHYNTTGAEIWQQSSGQITHFVAGLGSSGTFIGATRRLKQFNPLLQAISILPDSPSHGISGLKYFGDSIVPAIYNPHLGNRMFEVETEAAHDMVRKLARDEGLLVGPSSAAAVFAAMRIAHEEARAGRSAVIVAILPDSGLKYLSERFWEPV